MPDELPPEQRAAHASNRVTLILEGVPEAEGRIRLVTFLSELQNLSAALARISRETGEVKSTTIFNVEKLSYNSPMQVVVAPSPDLGFLASQVLRRFASVAEAVTTGASLDGYDPDLLSDLRALARPVGTQLHYARLLVNETQFELSSAVVRHIDAALEAAEECIGFIEGRLEQINIHDGVNTFHIYPEVGPQKVSCHFPSLLLQDAIFAVGRKVEISGTLKYRHGARFPYAIVVTAIEPFPPDDELPTWDDLRGRATEATGTLSSEAFVRELRNGWQ